MKNNAEVKYRVILTVKDVVITFNTNSNDIEDKLHFFKKSINIPEKSKYDENGFGIYQDCSDKIYVLVVEEDLDMKIFPLSEYKINVGKNSEKEEI